jgi:hypothetical protein
MYTRTHKTRWYHMPWTSPWNKTAVVRCKISVHILSHFVYFSVLDIHLLQTQGHCFQS